MLKERDTNGWKENLEEKLKNSQGEEILCIYQYEKEAKTFYLAPIGSPVHVREFEGIYGIHFLSVKTGAMVKKIANGHVPAHPAVFFNTDLALHQKPDTLLVGNTEIENWCEKDPKNRRFYENMHKKLLQGLSKR